MSMERQRDIFNNLSDNTLLDGILWNDLPTSNLTQALNAIKSESDSINNAFDSITLEDDGVLLIIGDVTNNPELSMMWDEIKNLHGVTTVIRALTQIVNSIPDQENLIIPDKYIASGEEYNLAEGKLVFNGYAIDLNADSEINNPTFSSALDDSVDTMLVIAGTEVDESGYEYEDEDHFVYMASAKSSIISNHPLSVDLFYSKLHTSEILELFGNDIINTEYVYKGEPYWGDDLMNTFFPQQTSGKIEDGLR